MTVPETRPSLILRLPNHRDVEAWNEFTEIYEPLVYRLALKLGLQHDDAIEAQQEVMVHLAKVVGQWQPDVNGTFRGWLYRVARNVMLRFRERQARYLQGSADSAVQQRIEAVVATQAYDEMTDYDIEFRKQAFAWASAHVRAEVGAQTWHAFWSTFIVGDSVQHTAEQLGMTKGNVYVARSRVLKRLRERIEKQMESDWKDYDSAEVQR